MRAAPVSLAVALAVAAAVACGPQPAVERGRDNFTQPGFSSSPSNVFACATCHATTAGGDASRILSGYPMFDVTRRPTWWGGAYDTLLDAVNECYVEFMRGTRLTPDDPEGRALLVYLESLSPDATSPALPLTVVKSIAAVCGSPAECAATQACVPDPATACNKMTAGPMFCDIPNGDPTRGADVWQRGCANCHGAIHTGAGRLGPKVTVVPEDTLKDHGCDPRTGARATTIEKIRHGKFFTIGGNMAPYSLETLTDGQIGDLLSYTGL